MSEWVDNEYALKYFSLQRNYKQVSTLPFKLRCSCPVCGDSSTDTFKARFWYYEYKGTKMVHCYNCDYSASFGRFLESYDTELHNEYRMEKYKESSPFKSVKSDTNIEPSDKFKAKLPKIEKLAYSERLDKLNKNHPIIKYVSDRMIPEDKWNRLWFTGKWQDLCNTIKPDTYPDPKPEYRLVIPIYNKDGEIESIQGRALKQAKNKYITIKAHDDATKIYGQDTIDESKDYVFILEGPIDSLFLDNAIAISGGSLNIEVVPYADKRIWVLDSECRHPDTIKRMQKLIDLGERVCFWDNAPWKSKDVNDMIMKEGAKAIDIQNYILSNTESGIMAQLRMKKFVKFYGE